MHVVNLALLVISLTEATLAMPTSPCSTCGLASGSGENGRGSSRAISGKSGQEKSRDEYQDRSARSKGNHGHTDDDSKGRKEDEKEGHKSKGSEKEDKNDNGEDGGRKKDDKEYDSDDKSSHGYKPTSPPLVSPAPYVNSSPASPAPYVNSPLPSTIATPTDAVQPAPVAETPTISSGNTTTEPVAEVSISPVLSSSINIKCNAGAGSLLLGLVVIVL